MKKIAVLQSNYLPWKGYFDIIHDVDMFIFYDDVQYTTRDWRNRNKIKTMNSELWLSVPVVNKSKREQLIFETSTDNAQNWQKKYFSTISQNYSKAPHYKKYEDFLHYVYIEAQWDNLSVLNQHLIKTISRDFLGIETNFDDSRNYNVSDSKHEKLLNLVKATGANIYVSGPAAKDYIVEQDYKNVGIEIIWKDYSGYPEYPQLHDEFSHNVSILDLLFNTGDNAPYYIWGWREETEE
jgi:uncharacterized protein Usg